MGEHPNGSGSGIGTGAAAGGEIDWVAVFDGLATNGGGGVKGNVADEERGGNENRDGMGGGLPTWDQLFPPPIPTTARDGGEGEGGPKGKGSMHGGAGGGNRPKVQHRNTYPYSAPISPTAGMENQSDIFAQLARSMLSNNSQNQGSSPANEYSAGQGTTSLAHLDLEDRLRRAGVRKNDLQQHIQNTWTQRPASSSSSSFQTPLPLPLPYPSSANRHSLPSIPQWPNNRSGSSSNLSNTFQNIPYSGLNDHPTTASSSTASTPFTFPSTPQAGSSNLNLALDTEDKRQRNTVASAKFRAKRKKHIENVGRRITELEEESVTLQKDVEGLKQENKFLREMVELKYGLDVGKQPSSHHPAGSGEWQELDEHARPPDPQSHSGFSGDMDHWGQYQGQPRDHHSYNGNPGHHGRQGHGGSHHE